MNFNGHSYQTTTTTSNLNDDAFNEILSDLITLSTDTSNNMLSNADINPFESDTININDLIGSSDEDINLLASVLSDYRDTCDEFMSLLTNTKNETTETNQIQQHTASYNNSSISSIEAQSICSPTSSISIGYSPEESNATTIPNLSVTTVNPIEYIYSGDCQPCMGVQVQNDFAYQQQFMEYDALETKKIQIKSQPRAKYRPRTQNESKNSAHYVRCEEGVKPEYPTILIPETWNFQADVNVIEVARLTIDKQPHPYPIDNKSSSSTYEDNALIFKQLDSNILYFRLTNEDFQNGYKTFMIEMIKSKQDGIVTKELIREQQLELSIFRFTRIFQIGKREFQRDEGSTEYSCIMSEAYGDVEIEHIGPRYGPMCGNEMVYVILKGRILKNDLKISIDGPTCDWHYFIENFTKNGNIVHFLMPAFPYPQFETMTVNIIIYYKDDEIFRSNYLYKGSLDQDLAALNLNDTYRTTTTSISGASNFNPFDLLTVTGLCSTFSSRKRSSPKATKRLNNVKKDI